MTEQTDGPRWQPLTEKERRVAGVLVEKAKTTPDAYPLTLNALVNGCNQKSNRAPQMSLDPDDIEEVLEQLREKGAITELQSSGRVAKYRHLLYDWLGVDKVELAVVAELLLRGEQSVGDLRGRASRMERIADIGSLRPVLQSLINKRLVIALTPEGRGQLVTHGLYPPKELEQIKTHAVAAGETTTAASTPVSASVSASVSPPVAVSAAPTSDALSGLQQELNELRAQFRKLETDLDDLRSKVLGP